MCDLRVLFGLGNLMEGNINHEGAYYIRKFTDRAV